MSVSTQVALGLMMVLIAVEISVGYLAGQAEISSLRDKVSSLHAPLEQLEVRDIKETLHRRRHTRRYEENFVCDDASRID